QASLQTPDHTPEENICLACGELHAHALFCLRCGEPLRAPAGAVHRAIPEGLRLAVPRPSLPETSPSAPAKRRSLIRGMNIWPGWALAVALVVVILVAMGGGLYLSRLAPAPGASAPSAQKTTPGPSIPSDSATLDQLVSVFNGPAHSDADGLH